MQGETGENRALFFLLLRELEVALEAGEADRLGVAIEFVADDGVTKILHVNADLVRTAGFQLTFNQRYITHTF